MVQCALLDLGSSSGQVPDSAEEFETQRILSFAKPSKQTAKGTKCGRIDPQGLLLLAPYAVQQRGNRNLNCRFIISVLKIPIFVGEHAVRNPWESG